MSSERGFFARKKPRGESRVVLFRSLATLHSAGISLVRSFDIMSCSFEDDVMSQACEGICKNLAGGHTISSSLAKYPEVFTPFHGMIVRVGEQTGALGKVLEHLANQEENQARIVNRMRSALVYPTVVAFVALVGLILVPPYVLDGIFKVIEQSGMEPPALTKFVMMLSEAIQTPWLWLVMVPLLLFAAPKIKTKLFSAEMRPYLLSVPGLGRCLENLTAARFADALALCQRAGMSIHRGLVLAASASGDPLLVKRMPQAKKHLESGQTLAESLHTMEFFSPLFLEILNSGEEVGRLDDMLDWVARACELELDSSLQTYADLMEPLVLMVVGVIVGVLVLATALPMVNLVQNL